MSDFTMAAVEARLNRLEHDIRGNGQPGMIAQTEQRLRDEVHSVRTTVEITREEVNALRLAISEIKTQLRVHAWLIGGGGFIGGAGIASIFGVG